jgi:hypothetical protein
VPNPVSPEPSVPTWKEDEISQVEDYINFVHQYAMFNQNPKTMRAFVALEDHMHLHITKIRTYLFEVKKMIDTNKSMADQNKVK